MKSAKILATLLAVAAWLPASADQARPTTDFFKKSSIYQILPQHFTQEGTLKKAREFIPHIKSLGIDIIYLCPIVEADDDPDKQFWSKRQKASGTENPRNPYRMKDYFKIDPRFGSDQDLADFIDEAHKHSMKVVLDLVYYHCGPKASFIKDHPDFVVRDAQGNVKNGRWCFPELNFKSPALREYLIKNMEYFIEKFGADGYRTDVEPAVPADFWRAAYERISKIKPDVIMIAEGERPDAQVDAYDANYSFQWEYTLIKVFSAKKPACELEKVWKKQNAQFVKGARLLRALDNHDTASDSCQPAKGGMRYEKSFGNRGMDAVQVLNFTIDGVPFIYNGNEFADDQPFSMFADNTHGRFFVGWENLATKEGWARMNLIRKLIKIRKANETLWNGDTKWLESCKPESVAVFEREANGKKTLVAVNTRNAHIDTCVAVPEKLGSELLSYGCSYGKARGVLKMKMKPYGYLVLDLE